MFIIQFQTRKAELEILLHRGISQFAERTQYKLKILLDALLHSFDVFIDDRPLEVKVEQRIWLHQEFDACLIHISDVHGRIWMVRAGVCFISCHFCQRALIVR